MTKEWIIPQQDAILQLAKLAAQNPKEEGILIGINRALEILQKSDKKARERLLVLSMAKDEGWADAERLERRLKGEYTNPHVAKVLEEKEKRKQKEKTEKEKAKAGSANRRSYYHGATRESAGASYQGSPSGDRYHSFSGQYGYRPHPYRNPGPIRPFERHNKESSGCFRCGDMSHQIKSCPRAPK